MVAVKAEVISQLVAVKAEVAAELKRLFWMLGTSDSMSNGAGVGGKTIHLAGVRVS